MAQLALAVAGAAAGSAFGPFGAQVGFALGSYLGSSLSTQRVQGPMSSDLRAPKIQYGSAWPRIYGRQRVAGMLLWASDKRAIPNTTSEGGKGGPTVESTTYTYEIDTLYGLAIESDVVAITRVWRAGELIYSVLEDLGTSGTPPPPSGTIARMITYVASRTTPAWAEITLFDGNPAQNPWPVYEAAVGTADAVAYRHRTTVGIEALNLGGSDQLPLLEFEVITAGSGSDPQAYQETFTAALSDYTLDSGSLSNFHGVNTPYRRGIFGNSRSSGTIDSITRGVPPLTATSFVSVRFHIGSPSTDDAMGFGLKLAGTPKLSFNPRREAAFDSFQRPHLSVGGSTYALGSAALAIQQWHLLQVLVDVAASEVRAIITNEAGTVIVNQVLSTSPAPFAFDQLNFAIDAGTNTADTTFAEMTVSQGKGYIPQTVDLADICAAELQLSGLDASQFDVSALVGIGVRGIGGSGTARQVIEALMAAYYFDWWCGDKLRAVRRGGTAVATIAAGDLSAGVDDATEVAFDPERANDGEVPARVALTAIDLTADYEPGTQMGGRLF